MLIHTLCLIKKNNTNTNTNNQINPWNESNTKKLISDNDQLIPMDKIPQLMPFVNNHSRSVKENIHFQLAYEVSKYGYGSLYNLFKLLGTSVKRKDSSLLIGDERITPLAMAHLFGTLLEKRASPKKASLIRKVRAINKNNKAITISSNYDQNFHLEKQKLKKEKLINPLDQNCSHVIISTSKNDNYWYLEISKPYVAVIWVGSEKGKVMLPNLNHRQTLGFISNSMIFNKKICASQMNKNKINNEQK